MPGPWLAVAVGAAGGALLRYAFNLWLGRRSDWLALDTLAANWLGAYLIGVLVALLALWPTAHPHWRLLLLTGFLGSFTTFSGFSLEVLLLLQAQRWLAATGVIMLHVCGSVLLTALGMATVRCWR